MSSAAGVHKGSCSQLTSGHIRLRQLTLEHEAGTIDGQSWIAIRRSRCKALRTLALAKCSRTESGQLPGACEARLPSSARRPCSPSTRFSLVHTNREIWIIRPFLRIGQLPCRMPLLEVQHLSLSSRETQASHESRDNRTFTHTGELTESLLDLVPEWDDTKEALGKDRLLYHVFPVLRRVKYRGAHPGLSWACHRRWSRRLGAVP